MHVCMRTYVSGYVCVVYMYIAYSTYIKGYCKRNDSKVCAPIHTRTPTPTPTPTPHPHPHRATRTMRAGMRQLGHGTTRTTRNMG